ncbi:MAG: hypothetical protein AWU57_316 [Marinobacter sp. T13-3]|nr:MAG: hypothetical protein AWU57_316 [Marinobacter sp. T13-3]
MTTAQAQPDKDNQTTQEPATIDQTAGTQTAAMPESERKIIQIVYILQALGFVVGLSFIAAVIVNYVKRGELTSEIARDHCSYQIRTFWWSLLWCTLSVILAFVVIGYFTAVVAIIWTVYRVIKGFIRLNDGKMVSK